MQFFPKKFKKTLFKGVRGCFNDKTEPQPPNFMQI
jgi:hypothetical protein